MDIILITNTDKVELLKKAGFSPCGAREIDGNIFYQYLVNDEISKVLNDNSKFSKEDYVHEMKLTF